MQFFNKESVAIEGALTFVVDSNKQLRIRELVDQYGGVQETVLSAAQTEAVKRLLTQ